MIMAAVALGPEARRERPCRIGLAGNLCRCTGYSAIYRSIERAGDACSDPSLTAGCSTPRSLRDALRMLATKGR